MKDLIATTQELTMSSREIAELTGKEHYNVKRDIKIMFEGLKIDALNFEGTYIDASNRKQTEYRLDRELTLTLVSGYNIKLRNAIVKRWQELEEQRGMVEKKQTMPEVKDPQLAAMVTMLTQLDAVKQEQENQRNELADLRAKITSSPQDYYTVAGYASLRGIGVDVKEASRLGRMASKLSKEQELETGTAHSEAFGKVKTYHVDILCQVFDTK
jgi:phage regulator Rha-like protein